MGLSWFAPSFKLFLFSALTVPLFLQLLYDIAKFSHTHAHIINFVWNSRTCISGHPRGMGGGEAGAPFVQFQQIRGIIINGAQHHLMP